ncbi:MAG: hypothetical protein J6P05_02490 [Lachnospiraceae bacterium]|nr:hypothetical protein [Lachnospiraceae bacterium]
MDSYFSTDPYLQFLLIPDTFGASEENRLDMEIENPKDAVTVSELVTDFCKMKQAHYNNLLGLNVVTLRI